MSTMKVFIGQILIMINCGISRNKLVAPGADGGNGTPVGYSIIVVAPFLAYNVFFCLQQACGDL
jgi:hypothetical protein